MKQQKLLAAIDLGGTNLKLGLLDQKLRFIDRKVLDTQSFTTKERLIDGVVSSVNSLLEQRRLVKSRIAGLGLGLPGPIDCIRGVVHFFPNIPGWKEVNLKKILEKRLGLKVHLDNDANLMALAEYRMGAAAGASNAVCLTLGTGVGGGLVLGGRLYRGSAYAAGEIGHMPVNEKGPRCNCGGIACLEAYVGNRRLLAKALKLFSGSVTLESLSRMARAGNARARSLWNDAGEKIGIALVSIVNLLNPDVIVIGGGVANAGQVLFSRIRSTVISRAMPLQARHVKIVKAKLGKDAGLIGAAILAREGI